MSEEILTKKLTYNEFGKPLEVLSFVEEKVNLQPADGEALIEMLYANINPSDMGMMGGSYGKLLQLPAIAGREGVAKIIALGDNTSGFQVGDQVRFPEAKGTWQSHCVASTTDLVKIPNEIDPQQAATLFINPTTALMLLESFGDLQEGDWIIQNAANSSVGTWVIQIAKAKGLKTINTVRRQSLEAELKAIGADVVIEDNNDYPKKIKELTGGAKPKLALNSIGGESVSRQIKCLADSGTCVTFGGMVGDPVRFPTRFLIFNDVNLCGFWMDKWMRTHSSEEIAQLYQRVYDLVIKENIKTPIQSVYTLDEYKEALEEFSKPRMGKILFKA